MRILFTSAHTLLDHGSGAARSVATLLSALRGRGHEVLALTGSLQDGAGDPEALAPLSPDAGPELGRIDADPAVPTAVGRPAVLTGEVAGVRHAVLRFRSSRSDRMLASEEEALFAAWEARMRRFGPDVVVTFGGLVFNRVVMAEAARRGVGTAFYLGGPGYGGKEVFEAVDAVLAVSQALAAECGLAGDPRVHPILPAVDLAGYMVERPSPEYVLFVNPQAAKGCAVFSAVAGRSEALGLPHRFLVVESRGTWAAAMQQFPALRERRNVTVLPRQADMRAVYRCTHTLMFPSLWFEAAGRVLREAAVSGIPVVAHRVGGVAETLPGGAELLDPPSELLRDWTAPVPEAFVAAWLAALDRLRRDPAHYAERSACARVAARRVGLASQVDRVERILEEARAKGRARRGAG